MLSSIRFRILHFGFLTVASLALVSCDWESSATSSVLLIGVEAFSSEYASCGHLPLKLDGIKSFCDESIRFTHAFAPSTMSQATWASVLTSMYPIEHGLWHNGSQNLSAKFKTSSEVAVKKGYRTAFFSGGAPVWRKSGLSQGFEIFDDYVSIDYLNYYRSALKTTKRFLRWLDAGVGNKAFFSAIFIADLQFDETSTINNLGEVRGKSYESQISEVSETINYLIESLKNRNIWNQTTVVLFGTNGKSLKRRTNELDSYSLYQEVIQVPLFIKPAQKKRDEAINWKIDKNVSLVDLGATLFDLINEPIPKQQDRTLEVTSLKSVLVKPEVNWDEKRYILIESAWPQWRGIGGSRFSIRSAQYSLIYDHEIKLYNTLIDRFELNAISATDPIWGQVFEPMQDYLESQGINQWDGFPQTLKDKLDVANVLWSSSEANKSRANKMIGMLEKKRPWDTQLNNWRASQAFEDGNWQQFLKISTLEKNKLWQYVAKKNLGQPAKFLGLGCGRFFSVNIKDLSNIQSCNEPMFVALHKWISEAPGTKKDQLFEKFFRRYKYFLEDKAISRLNYRNNLSWDIPLNDFDSPSFTELYLALPSSRHYVLAIEKRFKIR